MEAWKPPSVVGTATNGVKYEFSHFHFHWGKDDSRGAEHTYDGVRYPMEIHIVHYNSKYGSEVEAWKHPDGILVIAVFFQLNPGNNGNLDTIVDMVKRVPKSGNEADLRFALTLRQLLPNDFNEFFRYKGSKTTPQCEESILWIIMTQTKPIGADQVLSRWLIDYIHNYDVSHRYCVYFVLLL